MKDIKPWHYARMQIPAKEPCRPTPFQADAGNWVMFYVYLIRTPRVVGTHSFIPMTTIGMDGVTGEKLQ